MSFGCLDGLVGIGGWFLSESIMTNSLAYCAAVAATVLACGCSSSKETEGASDNAGNQFNANGGSANSNPGSELPPGQGMKPITQAEQDSFNGSACAGQSGEPEPEASLLEFVLDVSGTMRSTTAATNGQSKWAVVASSMQTALATLPDTQALGLEFFPNADNGGAGADTQRNGGQCIDHGNDVPIDKLTATQRTSISGALASIVPFANAATPTEDALRYAFDQLDARNGLSPGSKYAILITDGQPTLRTPCTGMADPRNPEDATPIIALIASALSSRSIKTFVVGSPGSEVNNGTGADSRGWLSDAAVAGGTRSSSACTNAGPEFCHFDMTQSSDFGAALTKALVAIGNSVVTCNYTVPASTAGGAIDPNQVNIVYTAGDGTIYAIARNTAANCQTGWHYTDSTNTQIEICGDSCDTVMNDTKAALHLYYGCATPIVVN